MELSSLGETIPQKKGEASEISQRALERLDHFYNQIEKEGKKMYLFFDIDGVLVKAGVDTPASKMSLDDYVQEKSATIDKFKNNINSLRNLGMHIGIHTGRGAEFSRKVAQRFFPKDSIEYIVCEGGGMILEYDRDQGKTVERKKIPTGVSSESIEALNSNREKIISYATETGGRLELGKEMMISLNAPEGIKIEDYFGKMKSFLESTGILNNIEVSHSATAIDITPKGSNKLKALEEVLGGNFSVFFGDAVNDENAMSRSIVNITPANAMASTKNQAKASELGIVSDKNEIEGITPTLEIIQKLYRFARKRSRSNS